nr:TRAP transporter small permease subunit [uncultured Roseovarius sp.]
MSVGRSVYDRTAVVAERLLRQVLCFVVFVLMVIIAVTMFAQAMDRYIIGSGFSAYDQLAKIAMIWLAFLGLPLVLMHRENIAADLLSDFLGEGARKFRNLLFDIMMAMLATVVLWHGQPVMRVGAFQDIIGTPFTYWSVYCGLNIGMALTVVVLVARIVSVFLPPVRSTRT